MNGAPDISPAVSVVVPVCDAADFLSGCMDALLAQTLRDMELILVDDASHDGSAALCRRYADEYPDRVVLVSRSERSGPGAARNAGIAIARGEFVGFADSDDAMEPEMFAELHAAAVREEADVVVCGFTERQEGGDRSVLPLSPRNREEIFRQENVVHPVWNKLFRRAHLERLAIRFPDSRCSEDMAFSFKALAVASRVAVCGQPLYVYLRRPGSASFDLARRKDSLVSLGDLRRFLERTRTFQPFKRSYRRMAWLHAVYYPCCLLFIDSLLKGHERRPNLRAAPDYLRALLAFLLRGIR